MRNVILMAVASGNLELSFMKDVQEIRMCIKSKMMNAGMLQKQRYWHSWLTQWKKNYQDQEKFSISQTFLQHQNSYEIV